MCALTAFKSLHTHQLEKFSAACQNLSVPITLVSYLFLFLSFLVPLFFLGIFLCFLLSQVCSIGVNVSQCHMLLCHRGCLKAGMSLVLLLVHSSVEKILSHNPLVKSFPSFVIAF